MDILKKSSGSHEARSSSRTSTDRLQPNRRISSILNQSHANLNQKDIARRYTNQTEEAQQQSDISSHVAEVKSCFTENYLVFSLKEKLPQETKTYLEKEDEVLDYCRTVNFNRNARRMDHITEQSQYSATSSVVMLPDEIDGDDRMGTSSVRSSMQVDQDFSVEHSMYIETTDSIDNLADKLRHVKRYSVIGNDQTFKQYTKNHAYENMNFAEKIPEK